MSDEKQTQTAVGTLEGIKEKPSGWYSVEINIGRQYPLRLDTKLEHLIDDAREARGQVATWTYTEQESENVNPNNGRPYVNRYLSGVEIGEHAAQANGQSQISMGDTAGGNTLSKDEWLLKDRAADRRALIATAVSGLKHTMPSDPTEDDLKKFNERVLMLSGWWHNVVRSEREGEDDGVPF